MSTWLRPVDLARAAGVAVQTVRRYEAMGLLPPAARGPRGYRHYGARHLHALQAARVMIAGYGGVPPTLSILGAVHRGDLAAAIAAVDACHAELDRQRREVEALIGALRVATPAGAVQRFPLQIGAAARLVGVRISTVRFWESVGLLQPRRDPASRYRRYDAAEFRHLQLVALLRAAGYDVAAIQTILAELAAGSPERALAAAEQRLTDLTATSRRGIAATAAFWEYVEEFSTDEEAKG